MYFFSLPMRGSTHRGELRAKEKAEQVSDPAAGYQVLD